MSILLRVGSTGADVGRLETRLTELSLYTGRVDNVFGGGVEAGVKSFQKSNGLTADGIVGDQTWAALFPDDAAPAPPTNPLADAPMVQRCLALTGTFETSTPPPGCYSGLTGDFDGQGLSFGVLQWNIGQGTLQPMLSQMIAQHGDVARNVFNDQLPALQSMLQLPRAGQLAWARGIQDPVRHQIQTPWKGLFTALGQTPEFQAIQCDFASAIHNAAMQLCTRFGVVSERAIALMFDIRVQNGSISSATEAIIRTDFATIPTDAAPMDAELARLQSIANRRAEAASAAFVEDVRTRKLTIANGTGTVHGMAYDLDRQFGIRLQSAI